MTSRDPILLLLGLRGSGKSTLGRLLAQAQHKVMIDLDERVLASFDDCQSVGDIFGTPRLSSLKCLDPKQSSRIISNVQRVSNTSAAIATGQNCL